MKVLEDIRIPRTLIRDTAQFGGRQDGGYLRGDLHLGDNGLLTLVAAPETPQPRLVIPALVEPHVHLDKCHTIERIGPVGGDLATALDAQRCDKAHWTGDDLRRRATRGLREAKAAGCRLLRTHVDWGEDSGAPLNWQVLAELREDGLAVQCAALVGIDQMAEADFANAVARRIAGDGGVLGAFVLHHHRVDEGLRAMFAAADRFGLPLDFHVDEGLGDWNGLEAIADMALETGFEGPILCGHAVSLIDRSEQDTARIADKLARASIFVCTLPTTNLYLQGRRAGTPDRRGLTRVQELHRAGVRVLVGSDNVGDAFCPTGQHDPRAALHLACLAAHLDPPLDRWLPAITTDAAQALGAEPGCVDTLPLADLRLCDVMTTADLIAGRAPLVLLLAAFEDAQDTVKVE